MTTRVNRVQDTRTEVVDALKSGTGASVDQRPIEAEPHAEEPKSTAHQNGGQVVEHRLIVGDTAPHSATDLEHGSGAPVAGACGYDAFEADFRGHHHTNAARRRGPYEHCRVIYRYGYDLGVDPRYRGVEWATVEQEARPRWEERNPNTWEQFKETIRYAWDTARSQP
jgi:hypothetical protein